MSCDHCESSSTNDVAEIGSLLEDEKSCTMEMLSVNFLTLEISDESLTDVYINEKIDDKIMKPRSSGIEMKSARSNDRRGSRRKNLRKDDLKLDIISLDELAWHDSSEDCWIAIYDFVYDCTEFLRGHPGGQDVILEYAGRDATIAFIGTGHSSGARKMLEKYLIGELPICERLFRKIDGVKIVE